MFIYSADTYLGTPVATPPSIELPEIIIPTLPTWQEKPKSRVAVKGGRNMAASGSSARQMMDLSRYAAVSLHFNLFCHSL